MTIISNEHQKIVLDSCEAIRVGVTYSYNHGQITKSKFQVYESLLKNIESIVKEPSNANQPALSVNIREVEGDSQEEVARLHDEPGRESV